MGVSTNQVSTVVPKAPILNEMTKAVSRGEEQGMCLASSVIMRSRRGDEISKED